MTTITTAAATEVANAAPEPSQLEQILSQISGFVWGPPLLILLVGTGIFFTFRLGLLQFRYLPYALSLVFKKDPNPKTGDVSSFSALCTALSATIGTGNIVGVATAIKLGGPGALFWMWMAALFGMVTKYAECLLAVKYRKIDANGQIIGGPMHYLEAATGNRFLAKIFAFFAIGVAFFGIGTFAQVNSIVDSAQSVFALPKTVTAAILTTLVAIVTLGGIKSIARVAATVVPIMAIGYVIACSLLLVLNASAVPAALQSIISSAFTGHAATGGFAGAGIMLAIQAGVARGVFSNESGLGSAPIAAAAAKTDSCVRQGLINMTGTFLDTIVICTMTGLALVVTGVWSGDVEGASIAPLAFANGLGSAFWGPKLVSTGLIFFAFTTILGWNYYGERCVAYLFGTKAIFTYKLIFIGLIASGVFLHLNTIWILADIVNGLMAIPNLVGLLLLRKVVIAETQAYFAHRRCVDAASALTSDAA